MSFHWSQITIIVAASRAISAREFGAALDPAGAGMYTTALSADGSEPATHYISSGLIDSMMIYLLSDGAMLYGAAMQGAAAQGITLSATRADADALVAHALVISGDPWAAIAKRGLMLVQQAI